MAAAATYEQHVFGLELRGNFNSVLAKSEKLLEKNAAAWDKFEARAQGGGLNKAMSRVNGLIARFEELGKVMDKVGSKSIGGGIGGGRASGGGVMNSHDARRKYEVWWDSQMKRQEAGEARAVARQQKDFDNLRREQARSMERAAKQEQAAMKPFANMWAKIGMKMQAQQFAAAQKKSAQLREDIGKIGGYLKDAIGMLRDGLMSVFSIGLEYGKKFVHSIVDAAKERGLLMTAYEVQLGSRGKAEKQLQKTLDIAQLTPASNMQVVDVTKKLMGAQFRGERLDRARAAWADVQAFGGDNAARQIQFWMSRIAARGEASAVGVSGIAKASISERFIREEMAKMLGKSVGYKTGDVYTDKHDKAVRDAISDRKVGSGMFETAVEKAILRVLHQEKLGSYSAKKGSESLAGVLSNLDEAVPTFLMRLNIDEWKGIKELKRFLGDVLSFFTLGTKEGREFAKIIEDLTNELLGGLQNITREDMSRFFYQAADAAKELVVVVRDAWSVIGDLLKQTEGKGLSGFLETTGQILGDAFGKALAAMIPTVVQTLAAALPGIIKGTAIGAVYGLAQPLRNWRHGIQSEVGGIGDWISEAVGKTSTASAFEKATSRQQARIHHGEESDAGMSLPPDMPKMAKGGIVRRPTIALIGEAGPEAVVPLGGGSGAIHIENLIIQCDESAMRAGFSKWLLEEIQTEVEMGGAGD